MVASVGLLPRRALAGPPDPADSWFAAGRRFVAQHGLSGLPTPDPTEVRAALNTLVPSGPEGRAESVMTLPNGVTKVISTGSLPLTDPPIGSVTFMRTQTPGVESTWQSFGSDGSVRLERRIGEHQIWFAQGQNAQQQNAQETGTVERVGNLRRTTITRVARDGTVARSALVEQWVPGEGGPGRFQPIERFDYQEPGAGGGFPRETLWRRSGSKGSPAPELITKEMTPEGAVRVVVKSDTPGQPPLTRTRRSAALQRFRKRYEAAISDSRQRVVRKATGKGDSWLWRAHVADFGRWLGRIEVRGRQGHVWADTSEYVSPFGTVYGRVAHDRRSPEEKRRVRADSGREGTFDPKLLWAMRNGSPAGGPPSATPEVSLRRRQLLGDMFRRLLELDPKGFRRRKLLPDASADSNGQGPGATLVIDATVSRGPRARVHVATKQVRSGLQLATSAAPAEVAGTLAHELGHLRDGVRSTGDGHALAAVAANMFAGAGEHPNAPPSFGALLPSVVAHLDWAALRRRQERKADIGAARLMATGRHQKEPWSPRAWVAKFVEQNATTVWTPTSAYDGGLDRYRLYRRAYLRFRRALRGGRAGVTQQAPVTRE